VASPSGELMWVKTNDYTKLMDKEFEKKIKAQVKEIC
jgi:hypothetical protein